MSELLMRHFFNEMERDAVLALADGQLSARAISLRLGLGEEVPTKLRNALTGLAERSVLLAHRDGYVLTNPLFAEVARRATPSVR